MKLIISKILLEELIERFDIMTDDDAFREDNSATIHITDSIYYLLTTNYLHFSEEEQKELLDEIESSSIMDYWQEKPMKNALKMFYIDNHYYVQLSKEQIARIKQHDDDCKGVSIMRRFHRYMYQKNMYISKEDYKWIFYTETC